MASEYLKWLARDEKPREKRELTQKEKWKNWWDYHLWHVVAGVAAVAVIGMIAGDIIANKSNEPDYQVAYVGSSYLPDDTVTALERELAALGEDLNGDGQVLARVNQYPLYSETAGYAGLMQLTMDMSDCVSFFYLAEDPVDLQTQYEILTRPDGSVPEEWTAAELGYRWSECPVLAGLELGNYTLGDGAAGDSQQLLSGLYIARRIIHEENDFESLEGCEALWQKLTAGAE